MLQTADDITQRIADGAAGDEGLIVRFRLADIEDAAASKLAGYPVYKTVESVSVKAPGQVDETFVDLSKPKIQEYWARRFPRHYQAFKAGLEEVSHGHPLKEWVPIRRPEQEMLQAQGLRTVEELAGITDNRLAILGNGGRALRQKAIDWLANAKSAAPTAKLAAENAELRSNMEVMARAIETLQKQAGIAPAPIVAMPEPQAEAAPPKRIRNRTPKAAEE